MQVDIPYQVHSGISKIQRLLRKIDHLHLPQSSRHDVESILVRQVSKEIDRAIPWQAGHCRQTVANALMIGQAVRLDANALHQLKLAALLHDIGLLMLPARLLSMLSSRELLDCESYIAIQNHPRLGATLLEPFSFLREAAILIAHHHERWDGSGYPYGVRGEFIPLGARILSIVDAFDAIHVPGTSCPETRNKIALRILVVASGTQFDPMLVRLLCRRFGQTDSSSRPEEPLAGMLSPTL